MIIVIIQEVPTVHVDIPTDSKCHSDGSELVVRNKRNSEPKTANNRNVSESENDDQDQMPNSQKFYQAINGENCDNESVTHHYQDTDTSQPPTIVQIAQVSLCRWRPYL